MPDGGVELWRLYVLRNGNRNFRKLDIEWPYPNACMSARCFGRGGSLIATIGSAGRIEVRTLNDIYFHDSTGGQPVGLSYHAAFWGERQLMVVDVWTSQAAFDNFA